MHMAWKAAGREHIECGWKKQHGGWPEEASNADGRSRIECSWKKAAGRWLEDSVTHYLTSAPFLLFMAASS
jgi:hypothetical protein